MTDKEFFHHLVIAAQGGDRPALDQLVRAVQGQVHNLAMRILVNPDDALEATQEILVLIVTKLSTFRGDSAFPTWVYRVATNYLLSAKKIRARDPGLSFDGFQQDLENGLSIDPSPAADDLVLLNELRVSCTMAMLLCLDLNHRIAYVLGDILEMDHSEAADILDISKDNYRKRLSRARKEVTAFTSRACGLASEKAKCSCPRRLDAALSMGRIRPGQNTMSGSGGLSYEEVAAQAKKLEGDLTALKLQTAIPKFAGPASLSEQILRIVDLSDYGRPQ